MYHGPTQILAHRRRDKYIHGLGTFSVPDGVVYETRHVYTCEQCGREERSPCQAEEPFYCHSSACEGMHLIGIDPA